MKDTIQDFHDDLAALEQTFNWWWHTVPEEIEAAKALLGLAEALQNRAARAENLPLRQRRAILRNAFMIHDCLDGSGMRKKLPA